MKFYCDNQEWDTDRPVYVLGHRILKSWFAIDDNGCSSSKQSYNCSCRKEYISNLVIKHDEGRSWVEDFILTSKDGYSNLNYKSHIVATSAKKAMEKFKKRQERGTGI